MSTISASTTSTTAFKITTDTTGALVFQTGSSPTTAVTFDASQNVGIGVTPSAWQTASGSTALQFLGSAIYGYRTTGQYLCQNAYYDGAWKYYASSVAASRLDIASGTFVFNTATSGTAGNAITFTTAMTLDASGNLGIGVTPSAWAASVSGTIENASGGLYPYHPGGGTYDVGIFTNAYYDGNWKYKNTGSASGGYYISSSTFGTSHAWRRAAVGTAGAAIAYTDSMTLDASGNLGIGTTSPACRADVSGMIRAQGATISASGEGLELLYTSSTPYFGNTNTGVVQTYNRGSSAYTPMVISASQIYFGTGGSGRALIDSTGNVTKPSNSCFLAGRSGAQTFSANTVLIFNSEVFDQNSNYNPNTGIFTAPVTGRYLLSSTVLVQSATVGTNYDFCLVTSNRDYLGAPGRTQYQNTGVSWGDGYIAFQITQICDMDANDTAYITFTVFGSGSIYGTTNWTRFSGCLIS